MLTSPGDRYYAARVERFRAHYDGRDAFGAYRRFGYGSGYRTGYGSAGRGACTDACGGCDSGSCGASFAPRCGYRFYAGASYARAVLGRRYWPVTSVLRANPEPSPSDLLAADEAAATVGPLVPLGPLAQAHEAFFDGDCEGAFRAFESLSAAEPRDARAWIGLAHASFALRRFDRAAQALREAAALGAIDRDRRLDVEAAYADPEAFRAHLSALEARVRFRIDDVDARLVLAYFEAGLGRSADARDDLRAVLRILPDDPAGLALSGRATPKAPEAESAADPAASVAAR